MKENPLNNMQSKPRQVILSPRKVDVISPETEISEDMFSKKSVGIHSIL